MTSVVWDKRVSVLLIGRLETKVYCYVLIVFIIFVSLQLSYLSRYLSKNFAQPLQ